MGEPVAALDGVRVLDLGKIYNGPYCGLLLAHLGADVIKVEPPGGESLRYRSGIGVETYEFLMLNSSKRSLCLDLKQPAGREVMRDLVRSADVLIENFGRLTMDKLGLGPEQLLAENPRLVYASGKGFGTTGPYADMLAMDLTVQAMAGVIASTGFPDGDPVKAGPAIADFMGGVHLAAAVLAALLQRERTGRGQHVEVAMFDAVFPTLASAIGGILNQGDTPVPERTGNRHSGLAVAPYSTYPAQDGYVAICCVTDEHWQSLARMIDPVDLAGDARYATSRQRAHNIEDVDERVARWTRSEPRSSLIAKLSRAGVPCAPVQTVREVITDPHLRQRGMIVDRRHPVLGDIPLAGSPLRLSESATPDVHIAPRLGADSGPLLAEILGYSEDRTAELRAAGVIE
jgi:crotonobetainyl-CoA:carnitine CoA-transferase CaiB-like acyl-CoA transferase